VILKSGIFRGEDSCVLPSKRRFVYLLALSICATSIFAIGQAPEVPTKKAEKEDLFGPQLDLPYAGSPYMAVKVAHFDAMRIPRNEAIYMRYLWLPYPRDYLPAAYVLLKYHANRLSRTGKFGNLVAVTQDVVRFDTRDFLWDELLHLYEKFAKIDFVFHQKAKLLQDAYVEVVWPGGPDVDFDNKEFEAGIYEEVKKSAGDIIDIPARTLPQAEIHALRRHLLTECPLLMANWWFAQSARQISIRNVDEGVGYYNWLGIKNRNDFFKLVGANEKVALDRFMQWRAVVQISGISQQSRIILYMPAISYGGTYGTLDTFKQQGRGQPRRNLRPNEFAHNAEEWYGFGANGLDIVALFDNKGLAQASAPDQIGPDDSALRVGKDARVHVNISCMRCHGVSKDMLQPVDDCIRRMFKLGGPFYLQDPNKKVMVHELEPFYLRDFNEHLEDNRIKFSRGVARCTATHFRPQGLSCAQITKLYGEAWNDYVERPVTPQVAARELGVSVEHLVNSLWQYNVKRKGIDLILAEFLDVNNGKLTRLEWEDSYQLAAMICAGVHPQEIIEEVKKFGLEQIKEVKKEAPKKADSKADPKVDTKKETKKEEGKE
jgi:hypothetical protein